MKIKIKKKEKIKVNLLMLPIILVVISYLEPRWVSSNIDWLHKIYTAMLCGDVLFALLLCFIKKQYIKGEKLWFLVFLFLYKCIGIISMGVNSTLSFYAIISMLSDIALVIILFVYFSENLLNTLQIIVWILNSLILFNIIFQFFDVNQLNTDATGNIIYFLNTRNHMLSFFLVAFILNILYSYMKYKKITLLFYLMQSIIICEVVYLWSATMVVSFFILIVVYLFRNNNLVVKIGKNPFILSLCGIGVNLAIVVFRIQYLFEWIIVSVLHRDLSFSYRTRIWDQAIQMIKEKIWFGYGTDAIVPFQFTYSKFLFVIPHNQFLDILIISGILGLTLFIICMLILCYLLYKDNNNSFSILISYVIFVLCIASITEKLSPYSTWYMLFCLIFFIKQMEKKIILGKKG